MKTGYMTNPQNLFKQANSLFDELRLDEAITLYKQSLAIKPDASVHFNLKLAEDIWHLQYAKSLVEKYPESISSHICRIHEEINVGLYEKAIQYCTDLLSDKADMLDSTRNRIASLRFIAALKSKASNYLRDDFMVIWQSLSSKKGRTRLLEDLLSVSEPTFAPIFFTLARDNFSPQVRKIFETQANLLEQLGNVNTSDLI